MNSERERKLLVGREAGGAALVDQGVRKDASGAVECEQRPGSAGRGRSTPEGMRSTFAGLRQEWPR